MEIAAGFAEEWDEDDHHDEYYENNSAEGCEGQLPTWCNS